MPVYTLVMRAARAFTLVELLVVLVVITLLIGITLPGVRMVQRASQDTQCLVNLRQTYAAIDSYMGTHKDMLPMCEFIPVVTENGPDGGLPFLLRGHLEQTCECWLCPCDLNEDSLSTGCSYVYTPGLLRYTPPVQSEVTTLLMSFVPGSMTVQQLNQARLDAESRLMTTFFRANPDKYPLLIDSADRHIRGGSKRNGAYFDGSVRPANPPPDNPTPGGPT
jgi:prepilin-type N-terminal cleavage/methylation domain-containing protein